MTHTVVARLSDGIRVVTDGRGVRRMWTAGRTRKAATCAVCGLAILKGEHAWRPLSNGDDRWHRAHGECLA